jgi:hypothetical protein
MTKPPTNTPLTDTAETGLGPLSAATEGDWVSAHVPPGPGGGPAEVITADSPTPVLPVLDICAHLLCNRLGISMLEESYLRYLAVRVTAVLAEDGVGA